MKRQINPPGIAPPAATYAHAVLTEGASKWLHTAGVVPARPDGSVPDDVGEQAHEVWSNIQAMLDQAGMRAADIVSVTTYAVPGVDLGSVMEERDRHLNGRRVASTLVTVAALVNPAWKIEIAIVAAS